MPYWEIIFETGAHSVVNVEDEDAVKEAIAEQHRRAIDGEPGGPTGHPAERIKRVLVYNEHPGEDHTAISKDEALARAKEIIQALADENGVIEAREFAEAFIPRPLLTDTGPHDSNYVAKESGEIELDFLPKG